MIEIKMARSLGTVHTHTHTHQTFIKLIDSLKKVIV